MTRLALLLLLVGCGPIDTTPRPFSGDARITNKYAESLFSLTVTPANGGQAIAVFSSKRIAGSSSALSSDFEIPAASKGLVDFAITGTSFGFDSSFTGQAELDPLNDTLAIVYDYDLAKGSFRVTYSAD